MLRLAGGARLRSRTIKMLVVLGAILALASIMVGSASATFPSPNGERGWYVGPPLGPPVTGTVDFDVNSHQGVRNVTCKLPDNTTVGGVVGDRFGPGVAVQVTVSGQSASPAGTVVSCTGTLLQEVEICAPFIGCFWTGAFNEDGPAVETVTLHIDNSRPLATLVAASSPNSNGWYKAPTNIGFNASDPNSGIFSCTTGSPFGSGGPGQSIGPPDGASKQITGGCENGAGLHSSAAQLLYNYDATAPTLSPSVSPDPVLRGGIATAHANADDNLSGVASSSCGTVDTSAVGTFSVSCNAMDKAGNPNSASVSYTVTLGFNGFLAPVDNEMANVAKAGQAVPLKFHVSDANGPVTDLGGYSLISTGDVCDTGQPTDAIEEYVGGASGLQNLGGGDYQINWKSDKSYAGQCRVLKLELGDGIVHSADFKFVK